MKKHCTNDYDINEMILTNFRGSHPNFTKAYYVDSCSENESVVVPYNESKPSNPFIDPAFCVANDIVFGLV